MTGQVILRGMTWDHSRGFDPMVATSERYNAMHPKVLIHWEKRSLQAFADRPIQEMMDDYDLMVIDHPHVGEIAKGGLLVAFDQAGRDKDLSALEAQSVGASHASYQFNDHQWALAIDAATPVATYRPDRLDTPPMKWPEVINLAKQGDVAFALIPINALMVFFCIAKNAGMTLATDTDKFIAKEDGTRILETMLEIVGLMDKKCLELDPIGIFEWMSCEDKAPAYSPYGYGYTNYSRDGYRKHPLVFANAPAFGEFGPRGTVLGGTGIAISASSAHQNIALDYAFWIASAECQSGLYFNAGGQPGNAVAWESADCNTQCRNFFLNTRKTLETSWVRPRYDGYMGFQAAAGDLVHACLSGAATLPDTLSKLDFGYRESRS
jgi:multiple sugar transport system substrate-binding protein